MRILIDMDGVLVDFIRPAYRHFGLCADTVYSSPEALGNWDAHKLHGVSDDAFYTAFDRDFWANLPWNESGPILLEIVEKAAGGAHNVYLCSTPMQNAGSYAGKFDWVAKHLPNYTGRLILTNAKHGYARSGAILVDDADKNVKAYREHGGRAVLVPRPWNMMFHQTCPIRHVEMCLQYESW